MRDAVFLFGFIASWTVSAAAAAPGTTGTVVGEYAGRWLVAIPPGTAVAIGDAVQIAWTTPQGDVIDVARGVVETITAIDLVEVGVEPRGESLVGMSAWISPAAVGSPAATEAGTLPPNHIPTDDARRREIQRQLGALGFDIGGIDGKFGPRTRRAIAAWQTQRGEPATGELTPEQERVLLERTDAPALPPGKGS